MRYKFWMFFVLCWVLGGGLCVAQTPVEKHGQLRVVGNQIVDSSGAPVQLRGMSMFWSQWKGQFYNRDVVKWLVKDWKITVIRAALGAKHEQSQSGYLYDPAERYKVIRIVKAAIKAGIYVIIDWHDHHADENVKQSRQFFKSMARKFGKHPNVIYEIFNEPLKVSWSEKVKPYSETIVKAIREVDPDNLIIIGTPQWCQLVDEAAKDPLEGTNLAYAFHFYAGTHGADLLDKVEFTLNKGFPIFVSEFGTCLASGDGYFDSAGTNAFFGFMDKHKLSWCNWAVSDKNETASIVIPGARVYGKWREKELTESGRYMRRKLRAYAGFPEYDPKKKKSDKKKWWSFR